MSHRIKGRHKPRHHTHAVKPNFSSVLTPLRTPAAEAEAPAAEVKVKKTTSKKEAAAEPALA